MFVVRYGDIGQKSNTMVPYMHYSIPIIRLSLHSIYTPSLPFVYPHHHHHPLSVRVQVFSERAGDVNALLAQASAVMGHAKPPPLTPSDGIV